MDREYSIAFINNNPEQFVWCKACCCFNHVDNSECLNCGSKDLTSDVTKPIEDERNYLMYAEGIAEEDLYLKKYKVR